MFSPQLFEGKDLGYRQLRFVFDGYSLPIETNTAITFNPAQLANKAVTVESEGDQITLLGAGLSKDRNNMEIRMKGRFINELRDGKWSLADHKGNVYPARNHT